MSYEDITQRLRFEAQRLMDGAPTTHLQLLVVASLLSDAADVLEKQATLVDRLADECKGWMNGVADVVEPLGYDRQAACGPSDLLPGLTELRNHDMENARRLSECVEARSHLYEQVVDLSARLAGDEATHTAVPVAEDEPDQDAHSFMRQAGSNFCVCGETIEHEIHVAQPNPFDEHTQMWENDISGSSRCGECGGSLTPIVDGSSCSDCGTVHGASSSLPPISPATLDELNRWYENNGREKQ